MRIRLPERYRDPGAWQYADYLLAQGIGAHASVRTSKLALLNEPTTSHATPTDRSAQLQCEIYASQSWASKRLLGYTQSKANQSLPRSLRLSPDDAGMLNAMLFGDRAGLNKTQRLGFERTGSFHLFVVSGMHVGLLAGLLFWLAQRLRLHEWLATPLILTLTFGYCPPHRVRYSCPARSFHDRSLSGGASAIAQPQCPKRSWSIRPRRPRYFTRRFVRSQFSDDLPGDHRDWRNRRPSK